MSFVTVKEQQGLSVLHSARSQLIGRRTQLVKALRVHQSEIGNVAARGRLGLAGLAASVRNKSGSEHRQELTTRGLSVYAGITPHSYPPRSHLTAHPFRKQNQMLRMKASVAHPSQLRSRLPEALCRNPF